MNKTFVSIAAMALAGAVSAQSSVSLYGRIDASIARQSTELGGITTVDPGFVIRSGGNTGSRWGLKGSEDLGSGLRIDFQLEQGFNIDDGSASSARAFHRQAWIGLSGAFGSLQVGRQTTTIDKLYTEHDPLAFSGYSAMGYAFNSGTYANSSRVDNAIYLKWPGSGGFNAAALWAPGENKNGAAGTRVGLVGLQALYGIGKLNVGGTWERQTFNAIASTTAWELGTTYDLDVARLFGQVEAATNKATDSKDAGYQVGVRIPMGKSSTKPSLALSYARENFKTAGRKVSTASAYSLMGQYWLGNRTYIYAAHLLGTTDPVVGLTTRQRSYGLGLVHDF